MPVVPKLPRFALSTLAISALALLCAPATSTAQEANGCGSLSGCAWKICAARAELERNRRETPAAVPGAQKHLANLEAYCRDDKERAKLLEDIDKRRTHLDKLQEQRADELAQNAKPEKTRKIAAEIAEEQADILRLERELKHFD